MRELTLLETGYLAGMLVLCLGLPLMLSAYPPGDGTAKRSCMLRVWIGQTLLAIAGAAVLASGVVAPYATVFGAAGYVYCAFVLFRQLRSTPAA